MERFVKTKTMAENSPQKVEINKVKGIFYDYGYKNDISIITSEGRFDIDAWNDCCGHSDFEFPKGFDQMVEACQYGNIVKFFQEEVNYLKTAGEQHGVTFEYEENDNDELENILFGMEVEHENGETSNLFFGVRSFHNGYYPVQISITHHYENIGQMIKGFAK